jgi:NRAMP (natural resistance-associated macrophage protein)-like metal ion transporter
MLKNTKAKSLFAGLLVFLSVLGPGIITGSVDNDAGGITTYSVAGATYGYDILWTLVPALLVLIVIQEMNARMGIVSGKGLADLIRENAGVKVTFFIFIGLVLADIGNTTTEFAGVAGSMQAIGVSKYIAVPLSAVAVWILVVKGTYKSAEKIFLVFSLFLLSYIVSALLGKPDWSAIGHAMVHPDERFDFNYIVMVIGIVGTTIAPWMQFYMQSSVIEKGLTLEKYKYTVADVIVGACITVVVAFFIIVACASTLHVQGVRIEEAKDAAIALGPLAGRAASLIFAAGLFVASLFSATILPIATAFYVCEAFGFEAGIDKKWKEAPEFYWLFTIIVALSVGIILLPGAPLIQITIWSQVINGVLLPVVLISMLLIINKPDVMGAHVNKPLGNAVGWTTVAVLMGMNAVFLGMSIFGRG